MKQHPEFVARRHPVDGAVPQSALNHHLVVFCIVGTDTTVEYTWNHSTEVTVWFVTANERIRKATMPCVARDGDWGTKDDATSIAVRHFTANYDVKTRIGINGNQGEQS